MLSTQDSFLLREATPADADAIARIHATSWIHAYREILLPEFLAGPVNTERAAAWQQEIGGGISPNSHITLALRGDIAVGFASTLLEHCPVWGTLVDNLHVLPEAKGNGVGRRLLADAARWSLSRNPRATVYLWVLEANTPALRFYKKAGGEVVEHAMGLMADGRQYPEFRIVWRNPALLAAAFTD